MDIPRYALIAASVLLGLMLLGEWTQFSARQQDAALPPTPIVEASLVQDTQVAKAMPSGLSSDSDLPVGEDPTTLSSIKSSYARAASVASSPPSAAASSPASAGAALAVP